MSDASKAVFLSYASQDAEAAQRICAALRAAGVEVWFDQNELVGGDAWDAKIRGQIVSCALFVPVISANTQSRLEGYFRREWKQAAERTRDMAEEKAFLLPVLIDATRDAEAKVPPEFKAVQWTRLPGGETPAAFCARVQALVGGLGGPDVRPGKDAVPTRENNVPRPGRRSGWLLAISTVICAVGITMVARWGPQKNQPAAATVPNAAGPATARPESEARQLMQRATEILERSGSKRESMDSASELANRAVGLDSTDEEVLGPAARIDAWMIYMGYDRSAERRQQAQQRAARAMALAPNSHAARWARAVVFAFADGSPAMLIEGEKILRSLAAESGNKRVFTDLGTVLRDENKFGEAAVVFERADDPASAGWNYLSAHRIDDARRMALALPRRPDALTLRIAIEWWGAEDLTAAYAIVNGLTAEELMSEGQVQWATGVFLARAEPEQVIRMLNAFPPEFFVGKGYRGPKRYFTGCAYALLGNADAARIEWHTALNQVRARLKTTGNDLDLLGEQAVLLACLGEKEEAEGARRLYVSMAEANAAGLADIAYSNALVLVELGRNDEAITALSAAILEKQPGLSPIHADVRFAPEFAILRRDPRFGKLLRDTLPKGAKPFDDPKPETKQ